MDNPVLQEKVDEQFSTIYERISNLVKSYKPYSSYNNEYVNHQIDDKYIDLMTSPETVLKLNTYGKKTLKEQVDTLYENKKQKLFVNNNKLINENPLYICIHERQVPFLNLVIAKNDCLINFLMGNLHSNSNITHNYRVKDTWGIVKQLLGRWTDIVKYDIVFLSSLVLEKSKDS
jgi:hypothetical protein